MSDPTIPDWINAVAASVGALAVVIGLLAANAKVNEAIRNARQLRRSQVAEELIALAFNVEDALRDIRNQYDQIPSEKAADKVYLYQRRYERIAHYYQLFQRLRDAHIRVRAVLGNEVDSPVDELFRARNHVDIAIGQLADYARENSESSADAGHIKELRATLYGSFGDRDELGKKIVAAVKEIEAKLGPVARLEVK